MRLPTFFIAGVPNAGTTSLHAYLGQHPGIYASPIKEPTFFGASDALSGRYGDEVRGQVQYAHASVRTRLNGRSAVGDPGEPLTWEEYLTLFRDARDTVAVGEGSVRYFWLPGAARAIRARLPDARLIFVLRDPAERLVSRYLGGLWRAGNVGQSFPDWFRAATAPGSFSPMVESGRYATHLARFLDLFPREQVRIHLYEDYRADPRALLRDLFTFLGVDPDHPVDVSRRENARVVPRFPMLEPLRRRISAPSWLPRPVRRTLRYLYHRRRSEAIMTAADRRLAVDFYREEIKRASELIGRDLSRWL